jgi:hypothetical protein
VRLWPATLFVANQSEVDEEQPSRFTSGLKRDLLTFMRQRTMKTIAMGAAMTIAALAAF